MKSGTRMTLHSFTKWNIFCFLSTTTLQESSRSGRFHFIESSLFVLILVLILLQVRTQLGNTKNEKNLHVRIKKIVAQNFHSGLNPNVHIYSARFHSGLYEVVLVEVIFLCAYSSWGEAFLWIWEGGQESSLWNNGWWVPKIKQIIQSKQQSEHGVQYWSFHS